MINPVFMIVIPLILAFISVIFKKQSRLFLIAASAVNAVMVFFLEKGEIVIGGFKPPFGISLVADNYSLYAAVIINVLFLVGVVLSYELTDKYAVVLLSALAGINGMLLTGDLFNLFVFLEIVAISAYILSSMAKKYEHTINYLVLGSIGSILYLLGIILLYSMAGSLNMADLSTKLAGISDAKLYIPAVLIFLGLAVEAKLMPLSGWVKGVYMHANRLVGALFASVFAGAILFVFGRVLVSVLPLSEMLTIIMLIISLFTFVFGEFAAFRQKRIKKILLYSSIGQAGLVVTLFVSGLTFPAILLLSGNIISKLIMFTLAGTFTEAYDTDDYKSLSGVFVHNKVAGVAYTIAALSVTGIPLFIGFYAKLNILFGYFDMNNYVVPIIVLLVAIVEGAYIIRMLVSLWAPGKEDETSNASMAVGNKKLLPAAKAILVLVISLTLLVAGLLPDLTAGLMTADKAFLNGSRPTFFMSDMKGGN